MGLLLRQRKLIEKNCLWVNVIKLVCHPERSADSAKPKDPFLMRKDGFFGSPSTMLGVAQNDTAFLIF